MRHPVKVLCSTRSRMKFRGFLHCFKSQGMRHPVGVLCATRRQLIAGPQTEILPRNLATLKSALKKTQDNVYKCTGFQGETQPVEESPNCFANGLKPGNCAVLKNASPSCERVGGENKHRQ